ncbi:D-2-hydroxyacid dehydrogenase [Shewanella sp. 202IG2-18]|uniref:D-2-hydroxyacid dehydrogenase n=1 Tax=Parashewanella hymeniacidonis TaxID=2807618 RepID=UPI00195F4423|nr:D-2-hydroxyacid dehydrogenase [Parashewanella hymeniacidonis]MBM7070653.1 D-2-hydroxyacid dehydrogenase [Parashewanella hymeniacidonis]
MSNKLLLLTQSNEKYIELLTKQNLPELEIVDDTPEHIARTNIWLADPPLAAPLLGIGKNLKWLQATYAGVDKIVSVKQRSDYLLTNVRDIFGPMMSEYVFSYLISHLRHHNSYFNSQKEQVWQSCADQQLRNKTMLILGTGSIGQHLAQTAKLFGMKVIGVSRSGDKKANFDECTHIYQLDEQLPYADVVVSVLPSSPQTDDIFNSARFSKMKENVIFFNVGRGNAVDLYDLNVALIERPNMLAVLDVFKTEPLPKQDEIWQRDNVVITPHIAAPSTPEQVVDIFAENYRRWLKGVDLQYQVDFKLGY